ncbi:MAG: MnmC family methyltransferase, partial [Bacteroidota bacterium]
TTLEPFPLPESVLAAVNYKELLNHRVVSELFDRIHELPWDQEVSASLEFKLEKLKTTLQEFETERTYDLVYFDAFAPNKQPELWEVKWLQKVHYYMKPGAILTTYCAKGQFKRDLKSVGFEVESLPGPPGKMEMVRASKIKN